jgi:hypothetical protein
VEAVVKCNVEINALTLLHSSKLGIMKCKRQMAINPNAQDVILSHSISSSEPLLEA